QPGECRTIRLPAFRKWMRPSTIWAGRGDRWVTQVLYAWKIPAAVKVVNISDRIWQTLVYENTISVKAQARESQRLDDLQKMEPPAVQTPNYPWPTKMMIRPSPGCEEARVINLQIVPSEVYDETVEVGERLSMRTPVVATTVFEVSEISEAEDEATNVPTGEVEEVLDDQDSDDDEFFDSISVEDDFPKVKLEDIPRVEPEDDVFSDLPVAVMACTPVQQLELEYERVMRISAEELDLEPAVYVHEGSETLSQLREQLALLPDIEELSPKCDIDSADVGESGTSTPEDDRRLRGILKYHRAIFLGDGNAVPAPARGVTCDLDVGEANPVAQRPRSVAPHLSINSMNC
ncbi:reverse transcriptase, partial [Phytophthora megakarya]